MTTTETAITDPTLLAVLTAATSARTTCLNLLDTLPTTTDQPTLSTLHKTLTTHLSHLRSTHRSAIHASRATKQATSEARAEVDALHLQLQNLHYERRHLRGEIEACETCAHRFRSLGLVGLGEFLGRRPEFRDKVPGLNEDGEVGMDGVEGESGEIDEEILMEERIEDEGAMRRELEEVRLSLVKRKEELVKEVNGKKEELGKWDAEVEKWLKGAEGLGKTLEVVEKRFDGEG